MEYLILWIACGVGAAAIASGKNRSVFGWLLGGFLLGPIGLLIVGFMGKNEAAPATGTERKCPHCAEMIKAEAKVCKHCGRDVEPELGRAEKLASGVCATEVSNLAASTTDNASHEQKQNVARALYPISVTVVFASICLFIYNYQINEPDQNSKPQQYPDAIVIRQDTATLDQKYPGTWQGDFHAGITKALAKNNVRDCGEYYYRSSKENFNEYLVYCTRDGKKWTVYLVWDKIENIMGPYPPDPSVNKPY